MSDPRSANNDPSMDDILASIRKIISDDEARAQVNSQQAAHQYGRPGAVPPFETRAEPKAWLAGDDVLMLTDLIEEPKPGDAPPPIPLPRAFDGTKAVVRWQVFHDSGRQWTEARTVADTEDASDHPILVADRQRVYLSWLTKIEGYRLIPLEDQP